MPERDNEVAVAEFVGEGEDNNVDTGEILIELFDVLRNLACVAALGVSNRVG